MATPAPTDAATTSCPTTGDVRLRRPDRSQVTMRFGCDDDLIPATHAARTIWSVVESLDLSAFHKPIKARDGVAGRDATDPALLVALWLYACIRGIGSARELARRCDPDAVSTCAEN
jgi:transposase